MLHSVSLLPFGTAQTCLQDNEDRESGDCSSVAEAAVLMWQCAHPNVVPITLLGLKAPATPLTLLDPCQVAYFGMAMADLSLEKRMG